MAKQKDTQQGTNLPSTQTSGLEVYSVSIEDKQKISAALDQAQFDVELGSDMLNLKPGEAVVAAVLGLTKVAKYNDFGGEKTEDALALLVRDDAAAGGSTLKSFASEVAMTQLKEIAEKAQSSGDPIAVRIECTGVRKREGKPDYKEYNIKATKAGVSGL